MHGACCKTLCLNIAALIAVYLLSTESSQAQVANPVITVTGANSSSQTVTVTITASTGTIYYTTNNTTPTTTSSSVASGTPLTFPQSSTLEVEVISGTATSDLITAQYSQGALVSSSSNGDHTVVLNNNSTVSAWGNGTSGQLGSGAASSSNLPTQTQISSGTAFSGAYAIRSLTSTTLSQIPVTAGLAAWYKADAITSAVGQPVTTWTDSSPNGNTVTQSSSGSQPTLITDSGTGHPAVQFNGSQFLSTTNTITGVNDITIISISTGNGSGVVTTVGAGTGSNSSRGFGNLNSQPTFVAGNSSGTLTAVSSGTITNTSNLVANTVTYSSSTGTVTFYTNGSQNGTPKTQSAVSVAPGLILGNTITTGNLDDWNGEVSEVIVYNRVLSAAERQSVENYLYNKYGIYSPNATWPLAYSPSVQAEIARDQLTQAQATAYQAFQAANPGMLTNGLKVWFSAGSITANNGALVSSWTDKAEGIVVSQTNSNFKPTYVTNDINGQPAVRFNESTSNNSLSNSATVVPGISQDMTIITVASTTTPTPNDEDVFYLGYSPSSTRGLGYYQSSQYFDVGGWITKGAASPAANTFNIEVGSITAPVSENATVTYDRNGTQTFQGAIGAVGTPNPGVTVGSGWYGDIAEFLVYDHQLSATELNQVSVYLANKYGLYNPNATWPLSFPLAVQTRIFQNQWTEAQANAYMAAYATFAANNPEVPTLGLDVWLKADAGVTSSSGTVTQWVDQVSTNTLTPTSTGANVPLYISSDLNGKPGIRFNGNGGLSAAKTSQLGFTLPDDCTIITVGMTTATSSNEYSVEIGSYTGSSGYNRALGYLGGNEFFGAGNSDAWSGASAPASGVFTIEAASLTPSPDYSGIFFYQNGANSMSAVNSNAVFAPNQGVWVGIEDNATNGWTGDLCEIMVYDHQLSSTEMAQVNAYLATKYNLALNGYQYAPPTITPPGGSISTGSFTVSISAAPAGTTVIYTVNGTTPSPTNGTTYSSPITISSSAPVSAAVFAAGQQISDVNTVQFYVNDPGSLGISQSWISSNFSGQTTIDPNAVSANGLTYLQDYLLGYSPTQYSTNGDGLSDSVNSQVGYAATDTDINGYLNYGDSPVTNAQQIAQGLDPFGVGDNPPPSPPPSDPGDTTPPTVTLTIPAGATPIQ